MCPSSQVVGVPDERHGRRARARAERVHVATIHHSYHSFPACHTMTYQNTTVTYVEFNTVIEAMFSLWT